ncbi:MAG: DEAD/DEAH box helicase, partial [Ignavibacteria bacterium]|nr:DEAD/DEAH box helicase [Ignavibacteria bacterium]
MAKSVLKTISDFFKKLNPAPPLPPVKPDPPRRPSRRRRSKRDGPPPQKAGREQKTEKVEEGRERPPRRRRSKRSEAGPADRPVAARKTPEPELPWNPDDFKVSPQEGMVRFHDLDLPTEVMRAIHNLGFHYCTPIQAGILPHTLEGGDATGRAQTGTGKSAAFLITILTRLMHTPAPEPRKKGTPRALILAPTRELVLQIEKDGKDLARYSNQSVMAVYGGMDYSEQQNRLRKEAVDIVTATPGRLLDFKRKRNINLSKVEILVIDEADRMLDMGFIPDVRRIIESTPMKGTRQTLFFSATLTPDVNRL